MSGCSVQSASAAETWTASVHHSGLRMSEYSWKDTNLALFGSDVEKSIKKESAESEPAWAPVRQIDSTTTMVWRIKQFNLEPLRPEEIGVFYSGDSYIVLHAEKVGDELIYDVYFWIGAESTQDEYGTAAYKTVELDTFLDDKATQHREVEGFESKRFKSYFQHFETLAGGYESGFNHVKPEEARKRLLHFHGIDRNHVELSEVCFSRQSITSDDVFLLDLGTKLIQWNGSKANKDERFKASQFLQSLKANRYGRCTAVMMDEADADDTREFLSYLPDVTVHSKPKQCYDKKAIYRLSEKAGELQFSLICEERLSRSALTQDDAYVIDTGDQLYVYIGSHCSKAEKMNAISYAHEYLKSTTHPFIPVIVVSDRSGLKELEEVLQ